MLKPSSEKPLLPSSNGHELPANLDAATLSQHAVPESAPPGRRRGSANLRRGSFGADALQISDLDKLQCSMPKPQSDPSADADTKSEAMNGTERDALSG